MRLFYLIVGLYGCLIVPVFSQTGNSVVTTQPTFPTANAEVTLIFDLKQSKDARTKGLLGKTDDVYLWSGAGATETGTAFEYQPTGQTDFAKPFTPGKMTSLGNDRWQIKLIPRTYFGVPASKPIRRLGLLLKSGDGKSQTEDLIIPIYADGLNLSRLSPTDKEFYVDANQSLTVRYKTSQRTAMTLTVDGNLVATTPDQDSLRTTVPTGTQPGVRHMAILNAMTLVSVGSESVADTFFFHREAPAERSGPAC